MLGPMHYCQACDQPTMMEPHQETARCPDCGNADAAGLIQPLFVITGASGSGKTAVLAPLTRLLRGHAVTFDVDWLLDAATAMAGSQPIAWPAFREAWLAVAHGVAQSGTPTVLLGPLIPQHLEGLTTRRWVGTIHYLALDCPDETRRARIEARPIWRSRDIDGQVEFGRRLRSNIPVRLDTSRGTPAETAQLVASWVLDHIQDQASPSSNSHDQTHLRRASRGRRRE